MYMREEERIRDRGRERGRGEGREREGGTAVADPMKA